MKAVLIYALPVWKVLKLKHICVPKKQPVSQVVAAFLICNWRRTQTGMIIDISHLTLLAEQIQRQIIRFCNLEPPDHHRGYFLWTKVGSLERAGLVNWGCNILCFVCYALYANDRSFQTENTQLFPQHRILLFTTLPFPCLLPDIFLGGLLRGKWQSIISLMKNKT